MATLHIPDKTDLSRGTRGKVKRTLVGVACYEIVQGWRTGDLSECFVFIPRREDVLWRSEVTWRGMLGKDN